MPQIQYQALADYCQQSPQASSLPVCLIFGEAVLCQTALGQILDSLIPPPLERHHHYEKIDGSAENLFEVIAQVSTFSLLGQPKVIEFNDARLFYARQERGAILEKVKTAYEREDLPQAAKYLLSFIGLSGLSPEDCDPEDPAALLKGVSAPPAGGEWLAESIRYCRENKMTVVKSEAPLQALETAIQDGFPEGNHLIITTDNADRRRSLFKLIAEKGLVVDCSVPKGSRRADKLAQESVLKAEARKILSAAQKGIERDAFAALQAKTGFDLRTFEQNLEKLIIFIGERKTIRLDDVEQLLERTKEDPIFELTNALTDRNSEATLFFIESLLSGGIHPLQALAAITNQIRKLLRIKGFVQSARGRNWHAGISFDRFKTGILADIQKDDAELAKWLEEGTGNKTEDQSAKPKGRGKKKASGVAADTDLLLLKNTANPYPVYQMFLKSEKFSREELTAALAHLSEADQLLKTTAQNPRLILEQLVLKICATA